MRLRRVCTGAHLYARTVPHHLISPVTLCSGVSVFQDPSALDRLAEHGDGRLAPNIARNSLYVKFDPLLGRPSVLPEIQRLAER